MTWFVLRRVFSALLGRSGEFVLSFTMSAFLQPFVKDGGAEKDDAKGEESC